MNLNSTGTDDHELVTRAASAPSMSLEAGQIRAPNDWFEVLSVWSEKTEQMAYVNKPSVPRRHLTVTGASAFMSKIFLKAEHCSTVVPANVEGTFVVVTDEAPATELRTISDFVGPLSDMYPKGVIKKPHRHCAEAWKAAMAVNGSWTGHKAEDSGEFRKLYYMICILYVITMMMTRARRSCCRALLIKLRRTFVMRIYDKMLHPEACKCTFDARLSRLSH